MTLYCLFHGHEFELMEREMHARLPHKHGYLITTKITYGVLVCIHCGKMKR